MKPSKELVEMAEMFRLVKYPDNRTSISGRHIDIILTEFGALVARDCAKIATTLHTKDAWSIGTKCLTAKEIAEAILAKYARKEQ